MIQKNLNQSNNSEPTMQQMHEYWVNCNSSDLANLFYFKKGNINERIFKYTIGGSVLKQLFDNVNINNNVQFRIYMAANPNTSSGNETDPSFTPIVQVFNVGDKPGISTNSFLAEPDTSESHALQHITEEEADGMIFDWNHFKKAELKNILEKDGIGRINYTTFDYMDSNCIKGYYESNDSSTSSLNIYLGYETPTDDTRPFEFRIILEINVVNQDGSPELHLFYEYSNPCPPLCD